MQPGVRSVVAVGSKDQSQSAIGNPIEYKELRLKDYGSPSEGAPPAIALLSSRCLSL